MFWAPFFALELSFATYVGIDELFVETGFL
jgi:hypothetical protein